MPNRNRNPGPPTIKSFTSSADTIVYCPAPAPSSHCENGDRRLKLNTIAEDSKNHELTYTYLVGAGKIEGEGSAVIWDLTNAIDGDRIATVRVKNSKGGLSIATVKVTIAPCCTYDPPPPPCPVVSVTCPSEAGPEKPLIFTADVKGGESFQNISYEWVTTARRIVEGKFRKKMTLDLSGLPFEPVTATVSITGADPSCTGTQASCTIRTVKQPPPLEGEH